MNQYEMTFHVERVDDSLVDMLIDDYEATVGTDHSGHEFVTVLVEGDSFDHAARTIVTELQSPRPADPAFGAGPPYPL